MRPSRAVLFAVLSMSACVDGGPFGDGQGADGGAVGDGGGTAADGGGSTEPASFDTQVSANEYNAFSALVDVTIDRDASVRIEYGEGEFSHTTPAEQVVANEPGRIQVLGLRAGRTFQLRAVATVDGEELVGETLSFSTDPLPDGWPTCSPLFSVPESRFDPDEVLCTHGETEDMERIYFCTDFWGETVFSVKTDYNDQLMSMKPLLNGGWASTSGSNAALYLFDEYGATLDRLLSSWFNSRTRFSHEYIDGHDVIQIQEGSWAGALVLLTTSVEWLTPEEYKVGNGLIVYDPATDEVLYDYHLLGPLGDGTSIDPRITLDRDGTGDNPEDWSHANSMIHGMEADGREYFLLSLKSQDWIVKLYPDNDEIGWILGREGDFTLVNDIEDGSPVELSPLEWAYHQHGIVPVPSSDGYLHLLMLDNGYPRHDGEEYVYAEPYSRVIEYRIDEERGLVDIAFEWGDRDVHSPEYFFTEVCGNVVLTEEADRVIALDGVGGTRIDLSYPEGHERWRMECQPVDICEYRVEWFPSLYERTWYY